MKINKKIKQQLKKISFVQQVNLLRRIKNDNALNQWVQDYDQCRSILKFQELGELNKDKNIFYIYMNDPACGFFAYWRFTILALAFACRYNLVPVVEWGDCCPYFQPDGYDGRKNVFEYYFEPVGNLSIQEAASSYNVAYYDRQALPCTDSSYQNLRAGVDFKAVNEKFITIRKEIREKLDEDIQKILAGAKTLGVHVRGVEWGKIAGHPIPVSFEKYVEAIDIAMSQESFERIYLATDSEDTIAFFQNRYAGKISFYSDVARAAKGSSTLAIFDNSIVREDSQFLMGYEVLRDMMTLSACDGLIASYSNISLAAETFKKESYSYKKIILTELNNQGIPVKKAVTKMKSGKF